MTLDAQDIQRIDGRKWAEESIKYAKEQTQDFLEGFIRCIKKEFSEQLTPTGAMTESEAKEFEKQEITFGVHIGTRYCDVPKEYLAWLVDAGVALAKYVKSDRFKRRED